FCSQFPNEEIHAGRITARSAKACDQTETHRVFGNIEDNWDRGSCVLGSQCSNPDCNDNSDVLTSKFGRQRRQSIILTLGPTVLDCHVSALDISRFTEDLAERAQTICNHRVGRYAAAEETNNWHSHLLRTRRERPRRRHAAGKCDELAPPHRRPSDRRWHSSIPLGVHAVLCTTAASGAECPLWVKSRHSGRFWILLLVGKGAQVRA